MSGGNKIINKFNVKARKKTLVKFIYIVLPPDDYHTHHRTTFNLNKNQK